MSGSAEATVTFSFGLTTNEVGFTFQLNGFSCQGTRFVILHVEAVVEEVGGPFSHQVMAIRVLIDEVGGVFFSFEHLSEPSQGLGSRSP